MAVGIPVIAAAAEVPEGDWTFRDLGLARRGSGPLAAVWWTAGRRGRQARTELLRSALGRLWAQTVRADPLAAADAGLSAGWEARSSGSAALVAVGSLGRGEAGPMSDLDLVVIHDGAGWDEDRRSRLARALWYPIWDAGFDLDQSFRSLAQCRRIASTDLPAATGLLSLTAVAGDRELAGRAASAVLADWRGAARRRLGDLVESVALREASFGHVAYRLEPDLKEARGGLRDAVVMDALVASWLAEKPRQELDLDGAREYLLDVRDALQSATRRGTDWLLMADQDATARMIDPHLTADRLLANLARAGRSLAYGLDTTMRRASANSPGRKALPAVFVRGRRQGPRLAPLAQGLAELDGEIVLASPDAGLDDPVLPLRAARVAALSGLAFEPLTVLALRRSPPLPEPWPDQARAELESFLVAGRVVVPVWEALDQAGLIVRIWPEWTGVRNLVQRNPFHRHTVDRHSVEAVAGLAGLALESAPAPLVAVAALFHDLGKRPGERDHSGLGALLARPLFARMGYGEASAAFMVALIRHHLMLAELATSCDPADPATVWALLDSLDHRLDLLDGLAALTEADARAAGPKAWTKQRAALVARLVAAARAALGVAAVAGAGGGIGGERVDPVGGTEPVPTQ
ncbi:MAG: HD domain-containing protein [Bifidobacteriaceae bacterium]|jgi:[protein-PII] uridylyltransferase|nr:HD domain-containing protein [Bifidobacteriaceae bacterium]